MDFTTGINPQAVAIADLDADGKPELTVVNKGDNTLSVFKNVSTTGTISTSSFSTKVDFPTGSSPSAVAITDLDGDGRPDIAVTNASGNTVSVFRNMGAVGNITSASFGAKVDFATGANPQAISL
ncbi:MAG: FG-GAP repeat domain-containing protein, partial [Flammeovirgaceae bacterium]